MNRKVQHWTSLGVQLHWDFISIHLCRGSLQKIKRCFCLQSKSELHRYIFINTLLNERKYCCRGALTGALLWSLKSHWGWGAWVGVVQCSSGLWCINKPQCLTGGRCLWPTSDSTLGLSSSWRRSSWFVSAPWWFREEGIYCLVEIPHSRCRQRRCPADAGLSFATGSVQLYLLSEGWYGICHLTYPQFPCGASFHFIIIYNHCINNNVFFRSFFQIIVFYSGFQVLFSQ